MKYLIVCMIIGGIIGLVSSITVSAAATKGVTTAEYKIGRVTVYEWRTEHNRLCTMIVDQVQSNAPFISCN